MKSLVQKLEEAINRDPWSFLTRKTVDIDNMQIEGLSGKEEEYAINALMAEERGESFLADPKAF